MAYEFPVVEFGLYEPDADLMVRRYGLPEWWHRTVTSILNIIRRQTLVRTVSNYDLVSWIEVYVPIVPAKNSISRSTIAYNFNHSLYTSDKLDTLLHTFPFSKEFIYKLLETTAEKERPDLSVVIEQFIAEQDYYEDGTINRFQL